MISIKSEDGQTERKVAELDISSFEKVQGANASRNGVSNNLEEKSDSVVEFAEEEFGDELLGEDEIPF